MTVDDSVMQKLWKLTNELTAQLVFNRNATLELKQQLADLQAKTAQGSVSVAQDITMFSNQEHADVSLRIANERLMEENAQLQEQVREYERWMEFIMTKFRLQNELALQLQEENAVLQARLVDVGAVARKAINEEYYNTESAIETLELENRGLREMLGIAADHRIPIAVRDPGNRVSFPSTGSYVASSGSDQERRQGHGRNASFSPVDQSTSALGASEWSASEVEPYMVTFDTSRTNTASNSKMASPLLESTKDFSTEPEPAFALDTPRAATTTATATATTTTASPAKKKTADTTTKASTANSNSNTSLARSTSGANTNASSNNSTTKGGMMINTGVATKKNVTNSSHPPISNSSALKTKKTQRKQKA
ncbi:hypothetical protein KI688_012324 [Linnemannia hyalina]|uniref:Uncharacterized protein n=1 Tax=Linnemannia hyalina TaxID=64524 RepID=A0A9P8BTD0_9FUNG|nr:hypothetical protein KI688_012324 [Linnemannia hyalina]